MIQFSEAQEFKIMRRDCRAWIELVAADWYASDLPGAGTYPPADLIMHLSAVYTTCYQASVQNMEYVTLLGFNVLRANTQGCYPDDVQAIVGFFLRHGRADNINYAQSWIELFLDCV